MPRVLQILNRLIIGGPAVIAALQTRYMAPAYETLLVTGGKDDHEQDATHLTDALGITPHVIPEMRRSISLGADRIAYKKMKALIREFKPDIVHTHAAKSGAIGRLAAFACKVPVVVHTFHGHVFHSYFSRTKTQAFIQIERYLARRSSGIIAISDLQKQELAHTYRICPGEKIATIPIGFDLDKFGRGTEEKRAAFRSRYAIADDEIAIGIIGRIVPIKNHALFVAAAVWAKAHTARKLRFIVVGDGDMRPQMEADFRTADIDYAYYPTDKRPAQAQCISWQTEIDEVLAALDIVALSSHNEGTPVSLIEAQAAARPVVSTAVGGVADSVADGKSGIMVPAGDAAAFGAALVRFAESAEMRESFGLVGRTHVMERYSYQRLVRNMDAYYQRLLHAAKHKGTAAQNFP